MPTVLLSYVNHTDPSAGGAVHGFHVVEQLRRLGYSLVTTEPRTDDRLRQLPRTRAGTRTVLDEADAIYLRCDIRAWDLAMLARNRRTRRLPVVVEVNSPPDEDPAYGTIWRFSPLERLRIAWRSAGYRALLRHADAAVCVSSQLADYVRERFPIDADRVSSVPNGGVPAEGPPPPRNDGEFRAVWMGGSRWPWQALDVVRDAARLLHDEVPHASVHLYSDADPAAFAGAPGVVLHGLVPHAEVSAVLRSMDAALCLRRGWPGVYGSPLKLFDYLGAGLPVVASAMGQITEVIEDGACGFLVETSAEEVAARLVDLARDPDRRRAMGEAAWRRVAEHYTWDHTGDRIDAVLRPLLAATDER